MVGGEHHLGGPRTRWCRTNALPESTLPPKPYTSSTNAMKSIRFTACLATSLIALSTAAPAATILLTNPGFEDGTNPDATGWVRVDGAAPNSSPSNYAEQIPGLPSRTMQLKSDGENYVEQGFVETIAGQAVDASTFPGFIIDFEYGYRRDAVTNGDHEIRVAVWNTTTGIELAGSTLLIPDPGVGANFLTATSLSLPYDNTAVSVGDGISLRFTSVSGNLGGSSWQRTAVIDNVSAAAIPEPSSVAIGALSLGLLALRRRR